MAGKKLEVGIVADVSDFQKKIKEVEFDLKELSKAKVERIKLGLDTGEINTQIRDVKKTLNDLKTTTRDTGNAFNSMAPKVANGGAALTSFSRIAQDAPYGIIGVGNNITNTAEQFGYLVKETGSAGGALKAMLSSLAGVGGVLLGVSLLTTGLTLMAQQGLTVSDVIDKMTGKFDKLGAEMAKASQEAAKQSGSEIANMKALVSVAQDENLSREKRLIAVRDLQKEFPAYFGNLSQEQILNGNVTGTVKELTQAIIERARASAFSAEIGKLAAEEFELTQKLLKAKEALRKEEEYRKKINQNTTGGNVIGGTTSASSFLILKGLKDDVTELGNLIEENKRKQDAYTKAIESSTKASVLLREETKKVGKPEKVFNTPQVSKANTGIEQAGLVIKPFDTSLIKSSVEQIKEITGSGLLSIQEIMFLFSDSVNELINNSLQPAFENLGQSIGEAIASGGDVLSNIGQSLIQSLGMFIGELGKKMITYGMLLAGFGKAQKAFEAGDATVKIGAGIAMVALGVAAVAAGRAVSSLGASGRASGGGGGSRGGGGTSTAYSSTSTGYSGGGMSGNVVFEISGQKLIGVLNNTLNGNKRLGGAVGLG